MAGDDYARLRQAMVDDQLRPRGVKDARVLAAMLKVPRHEFVPGEFQHHAYEDRPLPIGQGQTISQPYMVALMTELLESDPAGRVLEIGTGSGYQAAVLARLWGQVVTVERLPGLAARAADSLADLGADNVRVRVGDGTLGWPAEAPYDAILVTAGAPRLPEALTGQLAEGGRLVIPIGGAHHQQLRRYRRQGEDLFEDTHCGCVFVPLLGADGWPEDSGC